MRLQRPRLPSAPPAGFLSDLTFTLKQALTGLVDQVNNLSEGQVSAVQNATTAAPTTGTYKAGDVIRNSAPAVIGTTNPYVITGWICVASGTPGTFKELRCPTNS